MRVLLDECLPRRLRLHLPEHFTVRTVQELGWSGKRNGDLVRLAEADFDAFVTMDRNIEYQQNLAGYQLIVILVRAVSNRLADLLPLMPAIISALQNPALGKLRQVPLP